MTEPTPAPFARPNAEEAERWLRATREGLFPRRRSLMTADEVRRAWTQAYLEGR